MQLIDTNIRNLDDKRYRVTLSLATNEPIEDALESIVATVEIEMEVDNPLLSEVQGAALARVQDVADHEIRAMKVAVQQAS